MECAIESGILFCSISKGSRILYSYSIDRNLESLGSSALQTAPSFHSRFSHTAGERTTAFLFDDDGHTYFAMTEPPTEAVRFLELMRDGFRNSSKKDFIPFFYDSPPSTLMKMAEIPLLNRRGCDEESKGGAGEIWVEMAVEQTGTMSIQKNLSARAWMQQNGRRLWWRHVKIVVFIDALLCMVLFGIWLAVCQGFQCIA